MSSCFSRCLRVPIAIRAFYESYLWILQTLLLTHPDLHPGLLGHDVSHQSAHGPEVKQELKQDQTIAPQREIGPPQEHGQSLGIRM